MIPQIVVIDDDPIILKRAWNTLTSAGLKVVALKSGKALLEYIKDNSAPDLILMDISMPEMDGFETVKALKKSEAAWRDTPVIFLTGNEDEDTETKRIPGRKDFHFPLSSRLPHFQDFFAVL